MESADNVLVEMASPIGNPVGLSWNPWDISACSYDGDITYESRYSLCQTFHHDQGLRA